MESTDESSVKIELTPSKYLHMISAQNRTEGDEPFIKTVNEYGKYSVEDVFNNCSNSFHN
jgi:hypothetical protein